MPIYVGDFGETPDGDGRRTLHIYDPDECSCHDAIDVRLDSEAVFFSSLEAASQAQFTIQCTSCAERGSACAALLPDA